MVRKYQIANAHHLLNLPFTNGEIQSRIVITRLVKQGRKPPTGLGDASIDRRPLIKRPKVIKGTRIPSSTLNRFLLPLKDKRHLRMGEKSVRKLSNMYERLQYHTLRASGVNQRDARRLKTSSPDQITKIISTYKKNAKQIQRNYEKAYRDRVKAFKKQEREKLKPSHVQPSTETPQRVPEFDGTDEISVDDSDYPLESVYAGADTFLDLDEEPEPEPELVYSGGLSEPPSDDYPTFDEVLFGMSESMHGENDWEDIAETSGLEK